MPLEATPRWMVLHFGAHVVLAAAAQRYWPVATVWALAALLAGLLALTKRRTSERVMIVAAYVVGAELVWRGTDARVFWEYGKYVLILLLGIAVLQRVRGRIEWRGVVVIACMAPSLAVLPYFNRQEVAFNLSGPVALGLAVVFLSGMTVDRHLLVRLSVVALGPVVGLAFLATFGTLRADPRLIAVGGKATTAGIGSNQVSSVLGLGLFLVFVLLLIGPHRRGVRLGLGALGVWLGAQTVLSFSRGGLWTAAGSMLVAAWFLVRDRRRRGVLLAVAIVGFVVFRFVVVPVSDQISGGIAARRMVETELTGRDKIMKADWIVFLENPLLGVGPGQSYASHALTFKASNAHTEYTRLLAEHGSFGVIAIVLLAWMAWGRWRRKEPLPEKGIGLACMAWALLYMGHSAMRLAAPALMFGLGYAVLMIGSVELPGRWKGPPRSGLPLPRAGRR